MTNLIQLSGSVSQLVLHSKRSQFRNPMGGVRATPLSSPATRGESTAATHNNKDEEAAILDAFVPLKCIMQQVYRLSRMSSNRRESEII